MTEIERYGRPDQIRAIGCVQGLCEDFEPARLRHSPEAVGRDHVVRVGLEAAPREANAHLRAQEREILIHARVSIRRVSEPVLLV